ncbi:hypothetical protein [Nonomuraea helvata]
MDTPSGDPGAGRSPIRLRSMRANERTGANPACSTSAVRPG